MRSSADPVVEVCEAQGGPTHGLGGTLYNRVDVPSAGTRLTPAPAHLLCHACAVPQQTEPRVTSESMLSPATPPVGAQSALTLEEEVNWNRKLAATLHLPPTPALDSVRECSTHLEEPGVVELRDVESEALAQHPVHPALHDGRHTEPVERELRWYKERNRCRGCLATGDSEPGPLSPPSGR